MEYFRNYDNLIKWLENRAALCCEDEPKAKYFQVEWQAAQQLRDIRVLVIDERWDELTKLINRGVR